jgi:Family of unknown function (DUF5675)
MLMDGIHFAWTLEPRKDQSQGKPYCVDAGTYPVLLQWSQHFQRIVPCVQNVPNFTGVEIHPGNYPSNTHACCLVGETESKDFLGQSEAAFGQLMDKLKYADAISITYIN